MANCPSALSSAVTHVSDIPEGVAVAVTVSDPESHRRLLALADRHARIGDAEGMPEHSGLHGGPGDIGHCPIIHFGTQVTFSQIPHGVRFYVRALGGVDVVALRGETRVRVANLPRWVTN
jgi:hypothetical protein